MELRCGQSWNSCISLYLRPFGDDFPDQKHHSITSRREVIIKFIQIFSHITISSFFLGILIYPWPMIWYAHYMAHCPKKRTHSMPISHSICQRSATSAKMPSVLLTTPAFYLDSTFWEPRRFRGKWWFRCSISRGENSIRKKCWYCSI